MCAAITAFQRAAKLRSIFEGKALAATAKLINFSSVKSIKLSYNPFLDNVQSIREVAFQMSVPKRRMTNPTCSVRNNIRSDVCDPEIDVLFTNGHKALFKTSALTAQEIINEFNKLCNVHNPKLTK